MYFQKINTVGLAINSYILGDEKSKKCLVIDPVRDVVPYIIHAQNNGLDITDILETHVHADFVSGSKELKHALNEKPKIWCSGMGGIEWIPTYTDVVVEQGSEVILGDLRLKAMHTPGHTPEHVSWICYDQSRSSGTPWFMFTGDSIFVASVGRPDLLGKEESFEMGKQMYHTLFHTIGELPDFVEIYPSHGSGSLCGNALSNRDSSTLGYERLFNPYFKKRQEESWIKNLVKNQLPVPPYFSKLKKINLSGPPYLSSLKTFDWNKSMDEKKLDELFLIDIRQPELFALSYIRNSINIPFNHSFSQWSGWMLPENQPIGFIAENPQIVAQAIEHIRLMGFDQEVWVILMDAGNPIIRKRQDSIGLLNVEDLYQRINSHESLYILDVRTLFEWNSGHIPGAHHKELIFLDKLIPDLPKEKIVALVCKSGARASLAASLLKKKGFSNVMNVRGGMLAWKQAGFSKGN